MRSRKTSGVVAGSLRQEIASGAIAAGTPLPTELELIERFGVSRPSVREAHRILESEGLIVIHRGARGGARALAPDVAIAARNLAVLMQYNSVPLRDVYEARALIEPMALRLLAARPGRGDVVLALEAIFDRLGADMTGAEAATVWLRFYTELFDGCGNRTLSILYGTLTEVLRYELEDSVPSATDFVGARKMLQRILQTVMDGDGAKAADMWTNEMVKASNFVARKHKEKTVDASGAF